MPSQRRLALVASVLLAATQGAQAGSLKIVGNSRVDAESIRANIPVIAGGKVTEAALDEGLKSLFASGQFEDVKVRRQGKDVVVEVKEYPLVAAVAFEGNRRLKEAALAALLPFKAGDPLREGAVGEGAVAISGAYSAAGRVDAVVKSRVETVGSGRVRVVYAIAEGEKVGVTDVWFKGNESFSDAELRAVIGTKRSGLFSWLTNKDVYDAERVEADREALRAFYVSRGYADARVLLSDVDRLKEGFAVGFVLDEGQRYRIASVSVDSAVPGFAPEADGLATARLRGKDYDPQALAAAAERLSTEAASAGFPGTVATPRPTRNENGSVDVRFTLDSGPRVYVERIDVTGNARTRDYVIRRELDFAEGDLLDPVQIKRAERRLKALGIFEKVSIAVSRGGADDRAVLTVEAVDKKTGEVSVGGGYSTKDGPLANVSLSENNLFGTGRKASVTAGRGDGSSAFGLSVSEPYLFGNRVTAGMDVFRKSGDRDSDGQHAYDETSTGAKFTLTAPLTERFGGSVYYGLSQREVSDVSPRLSGAGTAADPDLIGSGRSLKSSVGYTLTYDGLDDPSDPAFGHRFAFGQEFAGVGGDVRFLKSEASADWYRQFAPAGDAVFHAGAKGGHVSGLGTPLAFTDHFRSGDEMVRGFADGGFGPRDAASSYHLGGTLYASATAEAIVQMPFLPRTYGMKGVVFADAGTLWNPDSRRVADSGASVVSDDGAIRAAVGAGILWDSPVGLLRANFAVPVAKQEGDREQVFSFSGGTRF